MSTYTGSSLANLNVLTPTAGTAQVKEVDDALRQIKRFLRESGTGTLVDLMYPIGSKYVSFTSNDPSVDIQNRHSLPAPFGTWVKLAGVFTVAHKDGDADFGTVTPPVADNEAPDGGTKEETLTVDQLPSHTHLIVADEEVTSGANKNSDSTIGNTAGGDRDYAFGYTATEADVGKSGSVGGDQPHNNLPPYRTEYTWVRTA